MILESRNHNLALRLCLVALVSSGCAASEISDRARAPDVPGAWPMEADTATVRPDWVSSLQDEALSGFIDEAIAGNFELARMAEGVAQARASLKMVTATRWPSLSAGLDGSRRYQGSGSLTRVGQVPLPIQSSGSSDTFGVSLGLNWEVDFLLRLGADQRRAGLEFLAGESGYEWARLGLVADVAGAYYAYREASQLLRLFERRLVNLAANLDIVESGYRQGINEALDVYLARSVLEQQRAQMAAQDALVTQSIIRLQRLLGRIPDGDMPLGEDLVVIDDTIPVGLPSELIARRQDLSEAWFSLLAADAGVAVAHKDRFPRISLVANTSDTTRDFDELLASSDLAWSLATSLTAPVFDAGRLKAAEQAARSRARQAEQMYMDRVAAAFAEVHQAIDQHASLRNRYAAFAASSESASAAADLSFEQYQRGLTPYVTVLESERRAFDADATLVRLEAELLRNRVALHRALGGDWQSDL